jgi:glycine/D-amino acid oxidase-like deaminating enzyme
MPDTKPNPNAPQHRFSFRRSTFDDLLKMQTDYLIVGQGLCGSWLSFFLIQAGARVMVVDPGLKSAASMAAAGVINPITGKRLARQWMADTIAPFLHEAYAAMGRLLDDDLLREVDVHTWFMNHEEAAFFENKAATTHGDLLYFDSLIPAAESFESPFGTGTIRPAYTARLQTLLPGWRRQLIRSEALMEADFDWNEMLIDAESVSWNGIRAKAVIDCSGAAAAENPYFNKLPFALNKGEVLFVRIPGLQNDAIYKYAHLTIAPWDGDVFWVGSSFDWNFTDALPTVAFRQKAEGILRQWLKLPFEVIDHKAAIRPATVTRDAFAGLHPQYPAIGILDGTGAKGCSLAPFLAKQLTDHLLHGTSLLPQVDIVRFVRTLAR